MITLNNGDAVRGYCSGVGAGCEWVLSGYKGTNVITNGGVLTPAEIDLYLTDTDNTVITSIIVRCLENDNTVSITRKIGAGASRVFIKIIMHVQYTLYLDGRTANVYDNYGKLLMSYTPVAHNTTHQDGGADEISVTGLAGLLADDQHVLDVEVLAAVNAAGLTLAAGKCFAYTTPTGNQTASGIIKTKTAGAALVFGNACYTGTDGKMEKALGDDAAITVPATHMCLETIAENATGLFLEQGEAYDNTWAFDIGKSIYLSAATAGLITKTMPTKVTGNQVQVLGGCVEATTKIFWNPSPVIMEYA